MPYFLILPVFALWQLAWVATSITLHFTRFQRFASYSWAITLGSLVGFVLGNSLLLPVFWGVAHAPVARGILGAIVIFLGPFAASAAGVLLGAGGSLLLLVLLRRRTA